MYLLLIGSAAASYTIYADIPEDSAYADRIIRQTHTRLVGLIGNFEIDSLDIYIVDSHSRFDSLSGAAIPDWGVGVAIPYKKRIVIKSPLIITGVKSLGELVAHEYSHIVLHHRTAFQPVPRWLDEGMAMYVSAEWGWENNVSVSWAVVMGTIIPLTEIESLNRFESSKAQAAYAQSFLTFKYFIDTYGESSLRIFLQELSRGRDFDDALLRAIGTTYAAFNRESIDYIQGRYNLLTLIFNSNLLWIGLALIVIIGFILTRINRKKRYEQLDEYEKYHSSDFDYGDEVEKPDEDKPWD